MSLDRVFVLASLLLLPMRVAVAQRAPSPIPLPVDHFANVTSACEEPILLPEPTGPHQIGTLTYHWIDRSRPETLTADLHDDRSLVVTVYYPALRDHDGLPAPYFAELDALREGFRADRRTVPREIAQDLRGHACVVTNSLANRQVDPLRSSYPVVLISPGGNISRHWHTALAQELASNGWVVAVMSHAHSGLDVFPRGGFLMSSDHWKAGEDAPAGEAARLDEELATTLAADASFTLDQLARLNAESGGRLAGRVAVEDVAIIGHSRGGSTVGRACSTDSRFEACVVYDNIGPAAEVLAGLRTPQLTIRRPWEPDREKRLHAFLSRNDSPAFDVVIEGAIHMSFTDLPFVEPERHAADITPERAHEIVSALTLAFLDAHVLDGSREVASEARDYLEAIVRFGGDPDQRADSIAGPAARIDGPRIPGLPVADDASRGVTQARIAAARALADSLGTAAYLLLIDGEVVDAYGDVAGEYRLHSIRKSLLSTLYGRAVAAGTVDTSRTLGDLSIDDFAGLTEREQAATVRQLLQSRSGVFLPATHENPGFDAVRPARGSYAPGEHWFYSNWDFNALGTAYGIMTRENLIGAFARQIATPIGMLDFAADDGAWRYSVRSWHPAYVFRMSARDLARFGMLMLAKGAWNGSQVIPADWVAETTRRHSSATRPDGSAMPGVGYGLMWWTRTPEAAHDVYGPVGSGVFEATGTGGQLLVVAPDRNLVFVHRNDTDAPVERYRSISPVEAGGILKILLDAGQASEGLQGADRGR